MIETAQVLCKQGKEITSRFFSRERLRKHGFFQDSNDPNSISEPALGSKQTLFLLGWDLVLFLPFPIERRLSSFGLTQVKRKQYLCSNSTRRGELLGNSFLVLKQMLVNLLIRGRVLSAFARRRKSTVMFLLYQLASENPVPSHMAV